MAQVKASYSRNSATKHTGVDNLFDPARVEGLVGTCVDVAMNPVVLNDVDTSTPVPTAVADDDMLLLNTCVDGVGVAVLVILEVLDDVNTAVVTALVAEDDVLLLEAAADADVEVLVPPAVLGNAVSATVEGPEVEVLASPAVLEDVAFALGENTNEPSSPVKLVAGLASLTPIGVSMHCGGVVGPVESATIEVQLTTEVQSDSAWSDTGHSTSEDMDQSLLHNICQLLESSNTRCVFNDTNKRESVVFALEAWNTLKFWG